jgi:RNA polymerase sigma-70 factor (ECF subfamily)
MPLGFDNENKVLGKPVWDHLGEHLRSLYGELLGDALPLDLSKLVRRLERAIRARSEAPDPAFQAELMQAVPHLRAFAMSLTRDRERAEDLVQDTVLRAWDKRSYFEPGSNLDAWLFTIMRNGFFSAHRKVSREVEDADSSHASTLIALPDQVDRLVVQDLAAALAKLPQDQREALLLVGAEGMTYDEVAEVQGVATGTIKSRVNRARSRLAELMGLDSDDTGGRRLP